MWSYVIPSCLLFITLSYPSFTQDPAGNTGGVDPNSEPARLLKFNVGGNFALNCSPEGAVAATYTWRKNKITVDKVSELKDRYQVVEGGAVFNLTAAAVEDDYGAYACFADEAPARSWRVVAVPVAHLPSNYTVGVGKEFKLICNVTGKPYPAVVWTYGKGSNATDIATALGGRAVLREYNGVPNGELEVKAALATDAGQYTCTPPDGTAAFTVLYVGGGAHSWLPNYYIYLGCLCIYFLKINAFCE